MRAKPNSTEPRGFVLPYVLVAIAILAIAATIAAQRLQSTSKMIGLMQEETQAEMAFMNAEAETLYAYLTGYPVPGGMNIGMLNTPSLETLVLGSDVSAGGGDIWSAAGETRRVDTQYGRVLVTYRDVGGLVPLNLADLTLTRNLLTSFNIKPEAARAMAATLSDYIDTDHLRQIRGAERADYRLRQLPMPADSPLRSYEELDFILHWQGVMDTLDRHAFMDITTLSTGVDYMKFAFTQEKLKNALGLNSLASQDALSSDGILAAAAQEIYPSKRGRFVFRYRNPSGGYRQRVIELERRLNKTEKPFKRFWVYETTVLEDPTGAGFAQANELKNVFYAPSDNPQ